MTADKIALKEANTTRTYRGYYPSLMSSATAYKARTETRKARLRCCKVELLNHVGYALSTIATVTGLLNYQTFLQIANTHRTIIPLTLIAASLTIAYSLSKTSSLLSKLNNIKKAVNLE